jgi:predicted DNA repair protein MutK
MAGTSLLALIDDIATLLDDVAVMTKVAARQGMSAADDVAAMTQMAAKKTAGVLGDDLALNAQQVTGVKADRELPVVWAVAKGSMVNKAILVPAALVISAFAPWAITPLLMLGGAFLCYEGVEKLAHRYLHSAEEDEAHRAELAKALVDPAVDLVAVEKDKIKGAVRTDFILSAEIIVISLGAAAGAPIGTQAAVLGVIAVAMTVGVYGLVAGIVKLDDLGLWLARGEGAAKAIGQGILRAAPWLMKTLSVAGTAAMFLVGGGILVHGIAPLHHLVEHWHWLPQNLANAAFGIAAGALVLGGVAGFRKLKGA